MSENVRKCQEMSGNVRKWRKMKENEGKWRKMKENERKWKNMKEYEKNMIEHERTWKNNSSSRTYARGHTTVSPKKCVRTMSSHLNTCFRVENGVRSCDLQPCPRKTISGQQGRAGQPGASGSGTLAGAERDKPRLTGANKPCGQQSSISAHTICWVWTSGNSQEIDKLLIETLDGTEERVVLSISAHTICWVWRISALTQLSPFSMTVCRASAASKVCLSTRTSRSSQANLQTSSLYPCFVSTCKQLLGVSQSSWLCRQGPAMLRRTSHDEKIERGHDQELVRGPAPPAPQPDQFSFPEKKNCNCNCNLILINRWKKL